MNNIWSQGILKQQTVLVLEKYVEIQLQMSFIKEDMVLEPIYNNGPKVLNSKALLTELQHTL
jgi:hypothetical protein